MHKMHTTHVADIAETGLRVVVTCGRRICGVPLLLQGFRSRQHLSEFRSKKSFKSTQHRIHDVDGKPRGEIDWINCGMTTPYLKVGWVVTGLPQDIQEFPTNWATQL